MHDLQNGITIGISIAAIVLSLLSMALRSRR